MSILRRLLVLALLAGCGPKPPASGTSAHGSEPAAGEVGRFLPLDDQTVLSYDTRDENTGERGISNFQVSRRPNGTIELNDGGRVTRLELAGDGVRYLSGGYWLKAPLIAGACWPGRGGKTCITRLGRPISVPAGQFSDCLETVEQTASASITTVFCPGVGMVALDAESEAREGYQRVEARLRSHGPRVDINQLPAGLGEPPPSAVPQNQKR